MKLRIGTLLALLCLPAFLFAQPYNGSAKGVLPTPTRAGDVVYWDGTIWNHLAGNNSGTNYFREDPSGVASWGSPGGSGTVTSVDLTVPSWLAVTGNPVTGAGTLAITAAGSQTSHQVVGTCGSGTSFVPCALVAADLPSNGRVRNFGGSFGSVASGAATLVADTVYFTVPYSCTVAAWNINVNAGTATFDIWKIATGTAIPTVTNTITASALPAISTGTSLHSTTLTGWTTSVSANDIVGVQLKTVATATFASLGIECDQ